MPWRYCTVISVCFTPAPTSTMPSVSLGLERPSLRLLGTPAPSFQMLNLFLPSRSCVKTRPRSEEHTSELQSLMRISYAVFCLKKNNKTQTDQLNSITFNTTNNTPHTLLTNRHHINHT